MMYTQFSFSYSLIPASIILRSLLLLGLLITLFLSFLPLPLHSNSSFILSSFIYYFNFYLTVTFFS